MKNSFLPFTIYVVLGLIPYLTACDKTTEANSKSALSSIFEDPIQQINKNLATIKDTKQKVLKQQKVFSDKKNEFENLITQLKQELLLEEDADHVNNRLKNISEYDAYVQEIERRLIIMKPVPDKLLSYERSFEAKLKIASIMSEAELTELKNQLTQIQADLGNTLDDLVIDDSQIQRKSIEAISQQIKEEKALEKLQKKKIEETEKQRIKAEEQKVEAEKQRIKVEEQKKKTEEQQHIKAEEQERRKSEEQERKKHAENELNNQIEQELCDGIFTRMEELTYLSGQSAECINSHYHSNTLKLNKVTKLWTDSYYYNPINTFYPYTIIKKFYLNGVSDFGDASFQDFDSSFEFHFTGIKSISREQAERLYGYSFILYLTGIEDVSVNEGVYLARMKNLVVTDRIRKKLDTFK
jgi:phenylalanyl-tRNA synthetase alpha subunit